MSLKVIGFIRASAFQGLEILTDIEDTARNTMFIEQTRLFGVKALSTQLKLTANLTRLQTIDVARFSV